MITGKSSVSVALERTSHMYRLKNMPCQLRISQIADYVHSSLLKGRHSMWQTLKQTICCLHSTEASKTGQLRSLSIKN